MGNERIAEQLRIHPTHVWNKVASDVSPLLHAFRCGNCGAEPFIQNRATEKAAAPCQPVLGADGKPVPLDFAAKPLRQGMGAQQFKRVAREFVEAPLSRKQARELVDDFKAKHPEVIEAAAQLKPKRKGREL